MDTPRIDDLPEGVKVAQISPEIYQYRLGIAQGLALRDWEGHADFDMWEKRYIHLITGLKEENSRHLSSLSRESRVKGITYMIEELGAPLDQSNILGYVYDP